jgi:hypothetical protein
MVPGSSSTRPLSARGAFGVIVRLIGLLTIVYGVWSLLFAAGLSFNTRSSYGNPAPLVVWAAGYMIVGALVISFAPMIVSASYASARFDDD